jgi:enoyl-CoA hydratase/carnithine racemase
MVRRTPARDGVVLLTLDNPPANALTNDDTDALARELRDLAGAPDAPAVVLTGAGDRFFCAGGDIKELDAAPLEFALTRMRLFHDLLVALETYPRPLYAAVNGYAVGGGMELTLFTDGVFAVPHARFGFPEINHGVLPAVKGMREAARRVGRAAARRLLYTGEIIECDEAVELGLVDHVVDAPELLDAALDAAAAAGGKPPLLLAAIKRAIDQTDGWSDEELEAATLADMRGYFGGAEAKAARARFRS